MVVLTFLFFFFCKDNVKSRLGILYYAAATKEEVFPNGPITLESLTEIDEKHRALALDLIRVPTKADFSDLEVTGLLRHPFFIRCSEESRSRLFRELQMDAELFRVCNQDTLQAWEGCLDKSKFPDEEFEELKDTVSIKSSRWLMVLLTMLLSFF